jgi:hypothetical protein
MMRAWRAMTSLLVLVVAGCASTPQAFPGQDALAKRFQTNPEAATVYIYRPGEHPDESVGDVSSVLYVDQRLIGQTMAGRYFLVSLQPGTHVLAGITTDAGRMKLEVRAGQLYFVRLRVHDGSSLFTPVSVESGKRELSECCVLFENFKPGDESLVPGVKL